MFVLSGELSIACPRSLRCAQLVLEQLFEGATPLVARLKQDGPYASPTDMLARARDIVHSLTDDERIAVIDSHPRIGEKPQALKERSLTSYSEQGYERNPAPEEVLDELRQLNVEYEKRFGFRFVVFVNQRPHAEIVPLLRERLCRSREEENETALGEILAIAEDRMGK